LASSIVSLTTMSARPPPLDEALPPGEQTVASHKQKLDDAGADEGNDAAQQPTP
jgi:hypothetical protein